jgi:hypothetical protein
MTDLKVAGKPNAGAMSGIEPFVRRLYDTPGMTIVAVVEFRHDQRVQPASGSDTSPSVTLKITGCEIATKEHEGALREAQRALYTMRTARGTIDEETGGVELAEETMRRTGGLMHAIETARLRGGLLHYVNYIKQVNAKVNELSVSEMAHELALVADGLVAVLNTAGAGDDDDDE